MTISDITALYKLMPKKGRQKLQPIITQYVPELMEKQFKAAIEGPDDKEIANMMKPYKKNLVPTIAYGVVNAGGDVYEGYQKAKGLRGVSLGDAILASQGRFGSSDYDGILDNATGFAAGVKAKGNQDILKGQVVNDAIHDVFDPLAERSRRLQDIELDLRAQPNTGMYNYMNGRESRIDKGRSKGRSRQG